MNEKGPDSQLSWRSCMPDDVDTTQNIINEEPKDIKSSNDVTVEQTKVDVIDDAELKRQSMAQKVAAVNLYCDGHQCSFREGCEALGLDPKMFD